MKISLFEYLNQLEATAKAAADGKWAAVNDWNSNDPSAPIDTIETTRAPNEFERLSWGDVVHVQIANFDECSDPAPNITHILATQPKATLALIAKLREAVGIIQRACEIASRTREEWVSDSHQPAIVINEFQDSVVSWAHIEAPE